MSYSTYCMGETGTYCVYKTMVEALNLRFQETFSQWTQSETTLSAG